MYIYMYTHTDILYIHLLVLSALVVSIRNEHVHFSSHVPISHGLAGRVLPWEYSAQLYH